MRSVGSQSWCWQRFSNFLSFCFSKNEGLTTDVINDAAHDAPKEVMVARLLDKEIDQFSPSFEAEILVDVTTTNKISLNNKYLMRFERPRGNHSLN